ncbi:MAG: SUMF1/EgtB/PvdO family nonheme iron enzyme [Deltaproteobacteria bacterium]|nr:SUMF1/EgtB/PvdO family nonheme iron enzyme [Deltaproteobacteria bacterium]
MLLEALLATWLAAAGAPPPAPPGGALPAASPPPPAGAAACPEDMRLVRGVHHEQIQRLCTDYRSGHCFAFLPGLVLREPRASAVETCMDVYEWPNRAGATPVVMVRFTEAEQACAGAGKRLCTELEWELGCEGPRAWPWPYGFAARPGACNAERPYRPYDPDKLNASDEGLREREVRRLWQGAPSGSFPECVSPFGVVDLVGNVEEWVQTSRPEWPHRSALKGGYWSKPWGACRGTNERHAPEFRFYEIGFRCCRAP